MSNHHETVADACAAIRGGLLSDAKKVIEERLPFTKMSPEKRQYTKLESTRIFLRDGFVDRYSGDKLVFPPVLRILSKLLPDEFPFHSNWKMSECHIAYWQLFPTIDHVIPIARGGADEESNWVCTSQMRNSAKANWLLDELGWQLHEPGNFDDWDGLTGWFQDYTAEHPEVLVDRYIASWHNAVARATA